jgi:hypothetical protein
LARPDCIAFLAGLKMRAVMDGRVLKRMRHGTGWWKQPG